MKWEQVKEIMMQKGYSTTGIIKNESTRQVLEMYFIKDIPVEYDFPIQLVAHVRNHNEDCESCCNIEFRVACLEMHMHIATPQLPMHLPDWDKVEKVISSYGKHCRNFNPLEAVREIKEFKMDSVSLLPNGQFGIAGRIIK